MYQNILVTSVFWTIYFFLHSVLAGNLSKSWFEAKFPNQFKYYRFIYVAISSLGLLPIMYFLASTPSEFLLERNTVIKYLALMLSAWGVFIIKGSFRSYDFREFIGTDKGVSESNFSREGLLKYMRHPIYTGTILLTVGFWLFIPNLLNLVTAICIFIYLYVGIRLEEKKLIEEFGDLYIQFKKEVPMLFPNPMWIFKRNHNP